MRPALELLYELPVRRRPESQRADQYLTRVKYFRDQARAANVAQVTVRQNQRGQVVNSSSPQKWLRDELDRIRRAAIHQPLAGLAQVAEVSGHPAVYRDHRQARRRPRCQPLAPTEARQRYGAGQQPAALSCREENARQATDQDEVVGGYFQPRRSPDVTVTSRKKRCQLAKLGHTAHPKPSAVVEPLRNPGEPGSANHAANVGRQRQTAERYNKYVGQHGHRADQMKVVCRQRQ